MKTILVVPDSHAEPGVSNDRFEWLGNYIVDTQPDIIVNLGDMGDMPSLSLYDVGKKSFEGRSYKKDIDAVIDAQNRLFEPLTKYNRSKKNRYEPRWVITLGNHDQKRPERAVQLDRKLEGVIDWREDMCLDEFGWEVHEYMEIVEIEGIAFTHHFTSGRLDKPIGGVNQARAILNKMHMSSVQGHSHIRDIAFDVTATGREMFALVAGCYFEQNMSYASPKENQQWWRGVTVLKGVDKGSPGDIEFVSLKTLKKEYKG